MSSINFFTPVSYGNQSKTCSQAIREHIDNYFYLGGKKASVIDVKDPSSKVVLLQKSTSCLLTCLKVISYFTLILPALALLTKALFRICHTFKIDEELTTELPGNTNLCDYYEQSGIFRIKQKPITIDIETLNLNLDEKATVNPDDFLETIRQNLPQGEITLKQATEDVVNRINAKIADQANEKTSLEQKRTISLNDQPPCYERSSNIYFYSQVFGRQLGPDYAKAENLWLNRICKALANQGHIYEIKAPEGPAYVLQA